MKASKAKRLTNEGLIASKKCELKTIRREIVTAANQGEATIEANIKFEETLQRLKEDGYNICFFSNRLTWISWE
jgi:fructose-bisphosphate aldolase class 1